MTETAIFRDFTKKRRPIYFMLNDERYDARKALGAAELQEAMLKFRTVKGAEDEADVTAENVMEKLSGALELLLLPESHVRFMAALKNPNAEEPIDMDQLKDIFLWLVEQYTQRPSQALSDSSNSQETASAGTDSLAGVQLKEPIL